MKLEEVPAGGNVIFVLGDPGSGKASFANYLLGHQFLDRRHGHRILLQNDAKPHFKINHSIRASEYAGFEVFPLKDSFYLCKLPIDVYREMATDSMNAKKVITKVGYDELSASLDKLLKEKKFNYKLVLITSQHDFSYGQGHHFWKEVISCWQNLLNESAGKLINVINIKGKEAVSLLDFQQNVAEQIKTITSLLESKTINDEYRNYIRARLALLKKFTFKNSIVWHSPHDESCKKILLSYLTDDNSVLLKKGNEEEIRRFFKEKRHLFFTSKENQAECSFQLHDEAENPHVDVNMKNMEYFLTESKLANSLKVCNGTYALGLEIANALFLALEQQASDLSIEYNEHDLTY